MELEDIIFRKEARERKTNSTCSHSFLEVKELIRSKSKEEQQPLDTKKFIGENNRKRLE
jgi:hypothetical protein